MITQEEDMYTLLQHSYSEDHDCNYEDIILVSSSKEKLEAKMEELSSTNLRMQNILTQKILFEKQYRLMTPTPEYTQLLPKKKWKAGIRMEEITPEMQKERDDINATNDRIAEENCRKQNIWYDAMTDATDKFLLERFDVKVGELDYINKSYTARYESEYTYSIGEVDEI
jgi:hypothetical protein